MTKVLYKVQEHLALVLLLNTRTQCNPTNLLLTRTMLKKNSVVFSQITHTKSFCITFEYLLCKLERSSAISPFTNQFAYSMIGLVCFWFVYTIYTQPVVLLYSFLFTFLSEIVQSCEFQSTRNVRCD